MRKEKHYAAMPTRISVPPRRTLQSFSYCIHIHSVLALILYCLACGRPSDGTALRPGPALNGMGTISISAPEDVNCTSSPPEDNSKKTNVEACTKRDKAGKTTDVDALYKEFSWNTFAWIIAESKWRAWPATPVKVNEICIPKVPEPEWEHPLAGHPPIGSTHTNPNPIWDQNGAQVQFEVRIYSPQPRHQFAATDMMRSIEAQVNRTCDGTVTSPWGILPSENGEQGRPATIRLKLAWKPLSSAEVEQHDHFIVDDAHNPKRGLVAMHISIKSDSTSFWWTWATFSHVSNLERKHDMGPFFRDNTCSKEDCPVNQCPQCQPGQICKTQVTRMHAIDKQTQQLNARYHERFAGTPLQHYELVGIQRIRQAAERYPQDGQPIRPWPEVLASEIIEWDDQEAASCIGCHLGQKSWSFPDLDQDCRQCGTCLEAYMDNNGDTWCRCKTGKTTNIVLQVQGLETGEFFIVDMHGMLSKATLKEHRDNIQR